MVFNFVSDERFRKPVTRTELAEFGRGWASDNSRSKWCLVLKVFQDWRKARNKLVLEYIEVCVKMISASGEIGIDVMVELCQSVLDGRGMPDECCGTNFQGDAMNCEA